MAKKVKAYRCSECGARSVFVELSPTALRSPAEVACGRCGELVFVCLCPECVSSGQSWGTLDGYEAHCGTGLLPVHISDSDSDTGALRLSLSPSASPHPLLSSASPPHSPPPPPPPPPPAALFNSPSPPISSDDQSENGSDEEVYNPPVISIISSPDDQQFPQSPSYHSSPSNRSPSNRSHSPSLSPRCLSFTPPSPARTRTRSGTISSHSPAPKRARTRTPASLSTATLQQPEQDQDQDQEEDESPEKQNVTLEELSRRVTQAHWRKTQLGRQIREEIMNIRERLINLM
ncbi:MAG: hypothetical protein Q8P67_18160 [archaeon]|nr:hypothetical protein [archaeon]